MKTVYSLYDAKTKSFAFFGLFNCREEARRALAINLLKCPDVAPALYPADFVLFGLGEFNTGSEANPLVPFDVIDNCGTALQILSDYNPQKNEVKDKADNA